MKTLRPLPATTLAVSGAVIPSPPAAHAAGTTYYVDSAHGNDTNTGTTSTAPWKSLAKFNGHAFQPATPSPSRAAQPGTAPA